MPYGFELGAQFDEPIAQRLLTGEVDLDMLAGAAVRAPLEMIGIQDCLTKSYGSNNSKNLVKAVFDGLSKLRSRESVARLRGVEIEPTQVEEAVARGQASLVTAAADGDGDESSND